MKEIWCCSCLLQLGMYVAKEVKTSISKKDIQRLFYFFQVGLENIDIPVFEKVFPFGVNARDNLIFLTKRDDVLNHWLP
jgi:hypothetical protein